MANSTYDNAAPAVLMSRIGRRPMMIGPPAPDRREEELHRGKRGDDGADDEAARAVMPAVNRHQRHDDAEADEVNEDRQENDEQ